jgi:hypothetical protein
LQALAELYHISHTRFSQPLVGKLPEKCDPSTPKCERQPNPPRINAIIETERRQNDAILGDIDMSLDVSEAAQQARSVVRQDDGMEVDADEAEQQRADGTVEKATMAVDSTVEIEMQQGMTAGNDTQEGDEADRPDRGGPVLQKGEGAFSGQGAERPKLLRDWLIEHVRFGLLVFAPQLGLNAHCLSKCVRVIGNVLLQVMRLQDAMHRLYYANTTCNSIEAVHSSKLFMMSGGKSNVGGHRVFQLCFFCGHTTQNQASC